MDELITKQQAIDAIEKARAYIGHNMERAVGAAFIEILDDVEKSIIGLPPAKFATDTNVGAKLGTNLAQLGTDLISRQTVLDALDEISCEVDDGYGFDYAKWREYFCELPPVLGTNLAEVGTDCISKQQAIKTVGWYSCHSGDELLFADNALRQLPPIQPKRGRWIKLDMHRGMADHKCTACEQECYVPTCMGEPMYAYCPNCGADMRGKQNG